jgi:eukaryotic-like serine/threonine-protein kinase
MSDPEAPSNCASTWRIRAPAPALTEARARKREVLADQEADWNAGQPCAAEDYLARWPNDPNSDPDAASVFVAEFFQRRQRGDQPEIGEYESRLPEHGRSIANMIVRESVINRLGGKKPRRGHTLRLPEVGEELFGFRLRQQLGRGAFACVYLAEQSHLAGRPVVLKISAIEGIEPQTLARLQHTNIVPIYSVHEDARAGLRAVCMPYFGGANLATVLEHLWSASATPRQGAQLVSSLEAVCSAPPEVVAKRTKPDHEPDSEVSEAGDLQTPLTLLRGLSYAKAVAWIVGQLADGLHHAHQRGIRHRDIKPSNILLSAEGQPLLLDFNVSQDEADDAAEALLGGTVAYSAPEHLNALIERSPESFQAVDRRSDLYSLGLILAEMLTGQRPFEQDGSYSVLPTQLEAMAVERAKGAPSIRQTRSDVPWGMESIARKCLDPDPDGRYQTAEDLADDLRRLLDDRPLKFAPELSAREHVQKFFRRHPRLTTFGPVFLAATVLLVAAGSALVAVRGRLTEARSKLADVHVQARLRAHDAGLVRAQCLVNTTLSSQDHLREGINVCEKTLALYDSPGLKSLEDHPDWAALTPPDRRRLAEDHRELLLLFAGARTRLAAGDPETLRQALALLDQAEAIRDLEPSKALWLDRANYWRQLGETQRAQEAAARAARIPATSVRDHYLLAISYARVGGTDGYRKAVHELDQALRGNPRHYWSAIQRGICHMELGEAILAATDFGTCTGLWPEHAWGYFNRGCVLDQSGMKAQADADFTAAIDRDPSFVAAFLNRGLARLELKAFATALQDFDRALSLGQGTASVHAGRGIALESLGRHDEADRAFEEAFRYATPDPARIRLSWTYGFAVSARLPAEARAAFDHVLKTEPNHPQALYGRAMLAMNRGDHKEALRFFDRALEANPGFYQARRYRAVLLARQQKWEPASRDINWCLEREPSSGETLYAAACVASLAGAYSQDPRSMDQAIDLLRSARLLGSGQNAQKDPDLSAARNDPRFLELMSNHPDPGPAH